VAWGFRVVRNMYEFTFLICRQSLASLAPLGSFVLKAPFFQVPATLASHRRSTSRLRRHCGPGARKGRRHKRENQTKGGVQTTYVTKKEASEKGITVEEVGVVVSKLSAVLCISTRVTEGYLAQPSPRGYSILRKAVTYACDATHRTISEVEIYVSII